MSGWRKRRLRALALLAVGVLACGLAGLAQATGLLSDPELDTVDLRFELRGPLAPPDDVVVVAIDDVTFGELNRQWPFPRSLHGKAVDRLRRYDARVIAYDIQFTEPSDPAEDQALIEALRRSGKTVLATTEVDDDGRSKVLGGGDTIDYAKVTDGDATLRPDRGGVFRRMPYAPQGLRAFAVRTVERATGRPVDPDKFRDDSAWIDFHGPPRTVRRVSFSRLLSGNVDPSTFRDKIVVVGPVAPSLQDVRPTAFGKDELMPGAEIQANAISTVLRDFPLRESRWPIDAALIAILGLAVPLIALRRRATVAFGGALLLGIAFVGAAYLAFESGLIVSVTTPLLALVLGTIGAMAVQYALTALDREYVRMMFRRFVPEGVVDDLMKSADGPRLGGVSYDSTVLFSDIRGFTSYSEGKDPDLVLSVLNRYHSEMCEAILGNGGTLISYIGDGIMAAFGVPIPQDDHADRALRAARQMVGTSLDSFNEWMRAEGLGDGFRMGVGLNSGQVTAGNIGSERRLEYTAIGDTVNTAARLEGMTKGTPHQVFVAQTTCKRLAEMPDDLVLYEEMEVRGRLAPVKVFGVVDDSAQPEPVPPEASHA